MHHSSRPVAGAIVSAAILLLAAAGTTLGHVQEDVGSFGIELGWKVEPAYVGQPNAIQVIVHDHADQPVTDLDLATIHVVVSTAGQTSPELAFEPGFDAVEMDGPLGEYDAAIVPTAPGDYTFHLTGRIKGQAVDITATSSGETFDAVIGSAEIQFPAKLPSLAEVATHLDRIDARISTLQTGAGPSADALSAARTAAAEAQASADRSLAAASTAGIVAGLALLLALGLWIRLRRLQRATAG